VIVAHTARTTGAVHDATPARVGLGHVGVSAPTGAVLAFQADRAAARDALVADLDSDRLAAAVSALGLGDPVRVASRARDRREYLLRPDLGRLPDPGVAVRRTGGDIGIVLADGLSAGAMNEHGLPLLGALVERLTPGYSVATPVLATRARVALGDHVGQALGVEIVLVLIGERPGLSVPRSLGIYLTFRPRPGLTDAARNCVSNVHAPAGLGYAEAAALVAELVAGARRLGASGYRLTTDPEAVTCRGETT
jgi:ethanolamine ammonia-lyase small subunit